MPRNKQGLVFPDSIVSAFEVLNSFFTVLWIVGLDMVPQWPYVTRGTLVQDDSTCLRASKPERRSYWVCAPKAHALQREKPLQRDALTLPLGSRPWSLQLEEACSQQQRPSVAKYGFPGGAGGKEPACQCRRCKRHEFDPWVGKTPWRRAWQPPPVFLPGESHGQMSLAGYSPQDHTKSDTTEVT